MSILSSRPILNSLLHLLLEKARNMYVVLVLSNIFPIKVLLFDIVNGSKIKWQLKECKFKTMASLENNTFGLPSQNKRKLQWQRENLRDKSVVFPRNIEFIMTCSN